MAKITWFGHAAFKIEVWGRTVLVDPFLDHNPVSPVKSEKMSHIDMIFVTHDHGDHLGDAFSICNRTNAVFVGTVELADYARKNGVKNVVGLNIGGSVEIKGVRLTIVQATHSATRGTPTGVVIEREDKTFYHAGDTGLFGDMRLIGELYKLDVAMIPIGGFYTMNARDAAEAVKFLNPKIVIPMHYGTFPVLARSADEFVKNVKEKAPKVKTVVLRPGETYEL